MGFFDFFKRDNKDDNKNVNPPEKKPGSDPVQDELWQSDKRVIDQLIQSGSNPALSHLIEFVLLGKERALRIMGVFFMRRGYFFKLENPGRAILYKFSKLDPNSVNPMSREITNYCKREKINYDGWGAFVLRNEGLVFGSIENGNGCWLWPQSLYFGNWVNNKREGNGICAWLNGTTYEGQWKDNKQTGWGKQVFYNGDYYVGNFVEGKTMGRGIYVFAGGTAECGMFNDQQFLKADLGRTGGFIWKKIKPVQSGLSDIIKNEAEVARLCGLRPWIFIGAPWAPPAMAIVAALEDPTVQEALSGCYFIVLEDGGTGEWGKSWSEAGIHSNAIPVFFELDTHGALTGKEFSSNLWGDDVPSLMAGPLKSQLQSSAQLPPPAGGSRAPVS